MEVVFTRLSYIIYYFVPNSLLKTGKFAMNGGEDPRRFKIILLTALERFLRKSTARRRAIPVLDCPKTRRSSVDTELMAHSSCNAAFRTDEIIATRSSTDMACSGGCCMSVVATRDGRTMCRNIGSTGWTVESWGEAMANVAMRRHGSNSPIFAATCISVQRTCKNLIGGIVFRHLRTSRNGVF